MYIVLAKNNNTNPDFFFFPFDIQN